jgi:hypothetical protein
MCAQTFEFDVQPNHINHYVPVFFRFECEYVGKHFSAVKKDWRHESLKVYEVQNEDALLYEHLHSYFRVAYW